MTGAGRFSSPLGGLLAMLGVAIGLGNVWRFPYMMGSYGGSAFLLLYLAFALALAAPLLSAEWALGRATRSGPIGSYRVAFGSRLGTLLGALLVVAMLVANSYYIVVIAQIVYSAGFALGPGFLIENLGDHQAGLGRGGLQYSIALALLLLAAWVLWRGVRRGIEAASRMMVPAFGIIIVGLVGYALSLDGAGARLLTFLRPDFSALGPAEGFAALGQAFFSVGVGGTIMIAYGSYLSDATPLRRTALAAALGDTGAALLAALFIVPTVLHFGLDMAGGPGLLFATLPRLFAVMPMGNLLGGLFLLALTLMAFLSALAGLAVCVSGARDLLGTRIGQTRAIVLIAILEALLIWPSAWNPGLIGTLDLIFGSGMQILGALVAVLALVWGLGRAAALSQLALSGTLATIWLAWLRWVVPALLILVLGLYAADNFF